MESVSENMDKIQCVCSFYMQCKGFYFFLINLFLRHSETLPNTSVLQ